jgi:hypothetical protein
MAQTRKKLAEMPTKEETIDFDDFIEESKNAVDEIEKENNLEKAEVILEETVDWANLPEYKFVPELSKVGLPAKEDKAEGKKVNFTLKRFYHKPNPNSPYDSRNGLINIDGQDYKVSINPRQALSMFSAGILPQHLPAKGTMCLFRLNKSQSDTMLGMNFAFEGVSYKPKKRKDSNGNDITEKVLQEYTDEYEEAFRNGGTVSTQPVTNETGWVIGHSEVLARIDALAEAIGKPINEEYYEARKQEWTKKIVNRNK